MLTGTSSLMDIAGDFMLMVEIVNRDRLARIFAA